MNKLVRPYKQKRDACAIACTLMVLEYYNKINKANWYEERRLYRIYHSRYMEGTPLSAVAFHLAKNNLNVAIYHEEKNLFKKDKTISEETFNKALEEYKFYLEKASTFGLNVINDIKINTELLVQEIKQDKLIILSGKVSDTYHAILITGINNDKFIVCDPLTSNVQEKDFKEIESFMNTNIGKWFISVKDKT